MAEVASGDHLLPLPHLDGEGVEKTPKDGVGAVVEQRQGWHMAVPVDQNVGGGKQLGCELSRRDLGSSSVEPTVNDFGTAECQLHLLQEIIDDLYVH